MLPLPRPGPGAPRGGVDWHIRLENGDEQAGRGDGDTLRLPGGLPLGYHRLAVAAGSTQAEIDLIVAPRIVPSAGRVAPGARSWGLTAQLYGLRSERDWGIGDFTDLEMLCRAAGALGAAAIGVNPLHALFAAEPRHFSPYSPSSRVWLNYLYIDVTAVPGFAEDEAAQAARPGGGNRCGARRRPGRLRRGRRRQAAGAGGAVRALSPRASMESGGALAEDFRDFRDAGGQALVDFAVFEALHEHFLQAGGEFSWHSWPAAMRDPRSAEVAEFARERREPRRVLSISAMDCRPPARARGGMQGAKPAWRSGFIATSRSGPIRTAPRPGPINELVVSGASIGAPPDPLSRAGQNWGLAPLNPLALRRRGFAPLIAALRANMRHAGILRIDHVMGLRRLYWIPSGSPATVGRLCRISVRGGAAARRARKPAAPLRRRRRGSRHRAGRLPRHDAGGERAVLSGSRVRAARRRRLRAAGRIPAARRRLGRDPRSRDSEGVLARPRHRLARAGSALYPDEARRSGRGRRARGATAGCCSKRWPAKGCSRAERFGEFLPEDGEPAYGAGARRGDPRLSRALAGAADAGADRGRAGESEQANLPGTTDAHPNWRRRLLAAAGGAARRAGRWRGSLRSIAEARRRSAAEKQPDERGGTEAVAIRATYRLQFHKGFTFRDADGAGPLSRPARRQPSLCLAADGGAARLDARLRHRRPQPAQSRDRHRGGVPGTGRRARGARHGADRRYRAEPHGGRRRRQRLVARRAGMGRGLALRGLFRHQLGPDPRRPEGPGSAAGARRPVRRGARKRRDRAALRSGRGQLQRLVLRAPLSDLARCPTR